MAFYGYYLERSLSLFHRTLLNSCQKFSEKCKAGQDKAGRLAFMIRVILAASWKLIKMV